MQANSTISQAKQSQRSSHRLLVSYGAVTVTFEFLGELESLKLQQLNKYFYDVAVSRAQTRIAIVEKFCTVVPSYQKLRIAEILRRGQTYSLIDEFQGEMGPLSTNKVVGKHFLSHDSFGKLLKIYEIKGTKIITRERRTVQMSTRRSFIEICGYKNDSIFCTGGRDLIGVLSKVSKVDLISD